MTATASLMRQFCDDSVHDLDDVGPCRWMFMMIAGVLFITAT